MPTPRYLPNAPITEAIIDIRVQPAETVTPDLFEQVTEALKAHYPKKGRIDAFEARIAPPEPPLSESQPLGYLFTSADGLCVAQFRTNGFTFNRLKPYTRWEEIFPETMDLWHQYMAVAKPRQVTRLAARYINKLLLPLPIGDLSRYLTAPPQVPPGLPKTLRGFLTRVVIHDQQRNQSAIVVQAVEAAVEQDHLVVLLDIDAFQDVSLEADAEDIPSILGKLRDFKNDIFFKSITDETEGLFL